MALLIILMILSSGIILWFFTTTVKAIKKFNRLEKNVQNKLLLLDYYMVFTRRFTENELIKLSRLPDEDLKSLNKLYDTTERIKTAKNGYTAICP